MVINNINFSLNCGEENNYKKETVNDKKNREMLMKKHKYQYRLEDLGEYYGKKFKILEKKNKRRCKSN